MRRLEWGKFSAQFADFSGRVISGMSIIIDGAGYNQDDGGSALSTTNWRFAASGSGASAKTFHTIALSRLRAQLGHTPVILKARFYLWMFGYDGSYPTAGTTFGLFRVLPGRVTQSQATYRFRATGVTWEGDGYSPLHGTDVASSPFAQTTIPKRTSYGYLDNFEVGQELLRNLRANTDMFFMCRWLPLDTLRSGAVGAAAYWNQEGSRPYLEILYLNNLEFFAALPAGGIDLSRLLDVTTGSSTDWLYLGGLERGETSTPTKFYLRNFGDRTFPLVTVMRRHPRWSLPVQVAGSGTGKLDYVQLADTAVWQKYTITFTSSTAYSIKAEAYRKNPTSLNPAGGGAGWTGTTGSNWTAPSGGLTIPAAAWQPGTAVNDAFEVYVSGTDTDGTWPLDSDDQVQITRDVGGSPDTAGWRSIVAAYTRSTAAVTIDATSKKIPTRALITSAWTIGSPAFIGNADGVHAGTVAQADAASVGAPTFTGTGLNDLTRSGNYNGTWDDDLVVEIDGTGTPDTFKWSKNGGSSWEATGVAITGSAQLLTDGIYVTFGATTGHTAGDKWTMAVTSWGVVLDDLTADSTAYPAGAVVSTGLPVTSLSPGTWTTATGTFGAGSTPANRVPVTSTSGFSNGDTIFVQSLSNPATNEQRVVSAVGANYLDVSAVFDNAYTADAIVAKVGSGEVAMWARVVATSGTAEEMKIFRLGVEV